MSGALKVDVRGVGLLGPGLADWASGRALLLETTRWCHAPTLLGAPALLPAAERRRAGAVVRLSLAVAEQACAQAGMEAHGLATVFTSSSGDGVNCHALCEMLAEVPRSVSPTRFTNSVHNASAGYWHIATANRAPSTSLCAFDASFAAGLLEAATQCQAMQQAVLLVACDVPYPEPLNGARPMSDIFGLALLLDPRPAPGALARLSVHGSAAPATPCDDPGLDALRHGVPAARALPLLQALARVPTASSLVLEYLTGYGLAVAVEPT